MPPRVVSAAASSESSESKKSGLSKTPAGTASVVARRRFKHAPTRVQPINFVGSINEVCKKKGINLIPSGNVLCAHMMAETLQTAIANMTAIHTHDGGLVDDLVKHTGQRIKSDLRLSMVTVETAFRLLMLHFPPEAVERVIRYMNKSVARYKASFPKEEEDEAEAEAKKQAAASKKKNKAKQQKAEDKPEPMSESE